MQINKSVSQRATTAYAALLSRTQKTQGIQNTQGVTRANPANAPAALGKDSAIISLSPGAQLFSRALAAAQSAPPIRADKIAAAQARIARDPEASNVGGLSARLLGGAAQ